MNHHQPSLPSLSLSPLLYYDPRGMANYYSSSGYAPAEPSSMGFYSTPYSSSLDPSTSSQQALGSISPSNGGQSTLPGTTEGVAGGGTIMVGNWYNAFTPWTGISGQEPPLLQGTSFPSSLS